MAERYVSREDIAARLGVTLRQITRLVRDHDFPRRVDGRRVTFPSDRCFDWYIQFKQREAIDRAQPAKDSTLEEAEKRKAIADASIAEIKLATLRRELVSIEDYRRELREVLGRVRARVLAIPGEYAPQLLTVEGMPQAVATLRTIAAAVLTELEAAAVADDELEEAEAA
jgi:hypothetical protein